MKHILTIDIEGDGLDRLLNKQVFPEGNHFDAETVPWCCTVCRDGWTYTCVCKLPETTRTLPGYYVDYGKRSNKTKAYHLKTSLVPDNINGHRIKEFTDRNMFVRAIATFLEHADGPVFFKGYGDYEYDKDLLETVFKQYGVDTKDLVKLYKADAPDLNTNSQIHTDCYKPNQQYLVDGIKHNIEDAVSLYKYITRT